MKKFKVKKPQLCFNHVHLKLVLWISFHSTSSTTSRQSVHLFSTDRSLVPQYEINMLWDFLFTHKRRTDFIKNIFLNVLWVLKPIQINTIHQWVILPSITNRNVKILNPDLQIFNKIMTKKKIWNMTDPLFIPNRLEENFLDFNRTPLFHQIGSSELLFLKLILKT